MTSRLTDEELERFLGMLATWALYSDEDSAVHDAFARLASDLRVARARLAELELSEQDRGVLRFAISAIEDDRANYRAMTQLERKQRGWDDEYDAALALLDRLTGAKP